ncbi:MAG: hypothetical protein P8Q50_14525 [Octadecabacter sp.]|nr:hypothetical protein [Octadecabacter sp.]
MIYLRSAQSAVGLAIVILLASIFAPQPAEAASAGDFVGGVLTMVFCVAIIAVIAGLIGLVIYIFAKAVSGVNNAIGGDDNNDPDSRLFDIGSLAVAGTFLCLASFEGVTSAMSFDPSNRSEATYLIEQTPDEVWTTLETATSPDFPLPNILELFPQPVGVVTDEGTSLGAMRRVQFEGREGAGNDATRLTVSLDYDRMLAPSLFFTPATKGAAHLAMDVLARDVKSRAEGAI